MQGMGNVDPQELAKFSELAHRWWDESSEFRPLHEMNPLRLEWIARLAGGLEGKVVLDVGCGGIWPKTMARSAVQLTGIDLARRPLGVARRWRAGSATSNTSGGRHCWPTSGPDLRRGDSWRCSSVPEPASVVKACAASGAAWRVGVLSALNATPRASVTSSAPVRAAAVAQGRTNTRFIRPSELAGWCRAVGQDCRPTAA